MDSTIVASIISAAASIVVALLGNVGSKTTPGPKGTTRIVIAKRNRTIWTVVVCALVFWMVYAALFIHWDVAGMTVLIIPPVMWILSAAYPLRPSNSAALSLLLFPFAFAAEPLGKWKAGVSFENHFEPATLGAFVAVAFGTALIAWLLARWRMRRYYDNAYKAVPEPPSGTLAKGLSELAELHKSGVLSDEEFTRAKNKLLSD